MSIHDDPLRDRYGLKPTPDAPCVCDVCRPPFRTISGTDWKRSLERARKEVNAVRAQIKAHADAARKGKTK